MDKKLKIVIENCPQNHKCPAVNVCPVGALSQKDFEAPTIDHDKCILIGILLIDTLQAKIFNNSPFIRFTEDYNGGNLYKKIKEY